MSMSLFRNLEQNSLDFSVNLKSPTIDLSPIDQDVSLDLDVFSSTVNIPNTKSRINFQKDSELLDKKMQPLLAKLQNLESYYAGLEGSNDMRDILLLKDVNDKVIDTCVQICECYNIMFGYISELRKDSALMIFPMTPSLEVYNCLKSFIHVLVMFPYSFFHNLGLNKLTICEDITLLKPEHKGIYKKKLLSGLMPMKQLHNRENVTRYFLLVIIHYMQQRMPDMHVDWVCTFWSTYKKKLTNLSTVILEDQYKALDALLKYYSGNKKISDDTTREKVLKMKHYMLSIDANMFSSN